MKAGDNIISDAKGKAEILSNQFSSVFTVEDCSTFPNQSLCSIPPIDELHITEQGIQHLLENLPSHKAPGPDELPSQILKLCAEELAPILKVLFDQSLSTSALPNDWKSANITPIFKKGNRNSPANYRPISLTSTCCKSARTHNFSPYNEPP